MSGVLLLGACGGEPTDSDEVAAVTVPLEAVRTLAAPDGLSRVVDLEPTGDGGVWVLDSLEPWFLVLSPDGTLRRAFGQRGDGPEEFGSPWALVDGGGPSDVWTYDIRRHTLVRISDPERLEISLSPDALPVGSLISFQGAGVNQAPPWLERIGGGFLMARSRGSLRESALQTWRADLVLVSEEAGAEPIVHTPLADRIGAPESRYGAASTLLPYPVWTVCSDETLGVYDPLTNSVARRSPSGGESDSVELPPERGVEITVDRLFEMFYRQLQENLPAGRIPEPDVARRLTEEQNRDLVDGSAGVFPEYADMLCGSDGSLWIRRFDWTAARIGQGSEWIRIDPNGGRTIVSFPTAFRVFRVEDGKIWGALRDDLGVEAIAWVEVASLRRASSVQTSRPNSESR